MAQLAGVSYTTVSHVINGTRRVAAETAARVEKAVEELHFRPCARARGLRTGTSGLIGVLTSRGQDLYFDEVLVGIEDACREAGVGMIVSHSNGDPEEEVESIGMLVSKAVDAVLLNNFMGGEEAFAILNSVRMPIVIMQARSLGPPADIVTTDDYDGARAAIAHLIGLGHERIACIAGHAYVHHDVVVRRAGYLDALTAAALTPREDFFVMSDYTSEGGYESFKDLLATDEPPTAFFFYSDVMALGALRAAADLGLRIPQDVSIVGYDDISLAAFTSPRLTTVSQPKKRLGALAVRRALLRLADRELAAETIMLPVTLAVRESSGPAPGLRARAPSPPASYPLG